MISRIHSKLGTAGFIISILALVVALGGGAYAASGGLTGKQKKEVEKIAKKYSGKPGAAGATGATGPAGPAGSKGDAGGQGEKGTSGEKGEKGGAGEKGEKGAKGVEGSPWVDGGTLPAGSTETGTWGVAPNGPEGTLGVSISFNIPLASAPTPIFLKENEKTAVGCPGVTAAGTPQAEPGKLCVYGVVFEEATLENFYATANTQGFGEFVTGSAGTSGTLMKIVCAEHCNAAGVWAATAPPE